MTSATWAFDLSQQHSEHRTLLPAPRPPPSASPLYEGSMPFDTSLAASTSAGNFRHLDSTQDSASRSHIFDLHGDLLLQRSAALPKDDDGDDQLMPMIAPIDRPLSKASDISPPSNTTQPSSPQPLDPENGSNLYVAGLPSTVDDDTLRSTYAPFGNVISAKVMLSVETSRSRGFGFVLFEKSSHAELAKASLHGKAVPGHGGRMQVSVSKHKGENLAVDSRVAYLRNVPVTVSVDQVVEYCSTFGQRPKVSLRAAKAESTPSLLRAFVVEFQSVEAAKTCVAATHGKMPFGDCTAPVLAKLEEPQALRERRLQSKPASSQSPTGGRTPPASTTPSVSTPGDHSCSTTPTITIGNRTIVMQSASPGTMPAGTAATGSPSFPSWTPTTAAGSPIPAPPPMPMMGQPQPPFNIHVPPQGAYVNAPLPQALPSSTTSSFVYPSNVGQPQPVPSQAPPSVSYYVVPAPGDHAAAAPPYPHGTAVYVSSATQPGHHQLHHHQQQQHHPLSHHVGAPPPAQHNYPFTAMVGHHGIAPAHGSFAPSQQHLLPTPTAAPPPPHLFPASTLPQALSPSTTSPGYATTAPGGSAALLHPPTYAMPAPPPGLMQQQPQGFNMGGPTQFDIRTLPPQGYYAAPPHHGPM